MKTHPHQITSFNIHLRNITAFVETLNMPANKKKSIQRNRIFKARNTKPRIRYGLKRSRALSIVKNWIS